MAHREGHIQMEHRDVQSHTRGNRSRNRIISGNTLGPRVAACHAERSDARQRSPPWKANNDTRGVWRSGDHREAAGCLSAAPQPDDIRCPVHGHTGPPINRSTFQARYGRLGINITRRLLAHATSTPGGLFAANVNVPAGNHRISVSIADNLGRVGTRVVNLQVLR